MRAIDQRRRLLAVFFLPGLIGGSFVAALVPPSAHAQFPSPVLVKGPDLRLTSADAFLDRLRSANQRVLRIDEDRRPEIELERERLERLLGLSAAGDIVGGFDPAAARRLLTALQREEELRKTALEILERASLLAVQPPAEAPSPTTIDDLVLAAEEIRRNEGRASEQLALAQQLRSLSTTRPAVLSADDELVASTVQQQFRLHQAEADFSEAQAFEAEAAARLLRRRLVVLKEKWRPTDERIQEAETAFTEAVKVSAAERRDLARRQAETATVAVPRPGDGPADRRVRQELRNAELASIGYRQLRADARVLRARARVAALKQQRGLEVVDPELTSVALTIRVAGTDEAARQVETRLSQLPATAPSRRTRRTLAREREVLGQALLTLTAARRDFVRALTYADLREGRTAAKLDAPRSREVGLILSGLVVLAAVFLLARGYRWGQRLLQSQDLLPRGLRMSPRQQARLSTVAVLLWPVVVATTTAALLIWPVWGLSLTVGEAIRLVDRPFFFVDETGVSLLSLVKFAFAIYAANVLSRALREFLRTRIYPQTDWDIGLTTALDTLVHYLTMSIGLIFGLRFVGVGFSALAILAGVLGIGIGFGLRNITENFISGLIILAERPIKIGDFIELGPGDLQGQVRRIRARSTTVVTRDNVSVIIPNSEFVSSRVTNWSHSDPKVRIAIAVGVVYGSDVDLVRKTLLDVADRHGKVLSKPAPEVEFKAFGSSSLDFILRAWIDQQGDRYRIASDLHFAVDSAFRKRGIEIAFPQLDLHLKSGRLLEAFLQQSTATSEPPATKLDDSPTRDGP